MNYIELHIGDYEKATAHLTAVEDGIYGRLLRRYYDTEQPLPADLKAVQRLVRARSREEREAVVTILEEFFQQDGDGWRHRRCDEEIARYQEKRAKARRSAEARWNASKSGCRRNANASPDAMRTHSEGNAHQSPVTSTTPDTTHSAHTTSIARAGDACLPAGTDPEAWEAFEAHHRQIGRWSAARAMTARGQLRALATQGADTTAVLRWATLRGLSDLADCHRRMQADAAKARADDRIPGESLADASYRRSTGATPQPVAIGALAAALLGHDTGDDA